jgi:thiol:disulfide interchange protein DsbD
MRLVAVLFLLFVGQAQAELLPPEQAFRISAQSVGDEIEVKYEIAPGYYLYRDKFAFDLSPSTLVGGAPRFPPGKIHEDEFFGKVETYRDSVTIRLPIRRGAEQEAVLAATSQGCADVGVCYLPNTQKVSVPLSPQRSSVSLPGAPSEPLAVDASEVPGLLAGNIALLAGGFFAIGLALAFTPCVFPMVPILSGIIAGQGPALTPWRAFVLSAAYVLGMALTYAAAGIAAALSGSMLSSTLQNPWVLGAFALIFVLLALSMFGFYELRTPASWQTRLSDASNRLQRGRLTGVFAMGALSAVIVSPCVTAPLVGALVFISQSGDVARGGSALFAMALGMGAPLLAIGTSAGALLPKAGEWMDAIKRVFGVLLLGVAIWIVSPVIPAVAEMLAWAALLTMSAVYLRALDPLPHGASGVSKFGKGVGVIALFLGIALLVGALSGGRDVLQPLAGLRGSAEPSSHLDFDRVRNVADLDSRIAEAQGKYVMLDFYADWCVACKEMERFTFSDPRVQATLKDVVLLQADVTANTTEDSQLLRRFGLFGPPGIIFFDRQGREIEGARVIGFEPADKFLRSLDRAMPRGKQA